MKNIIKLSLLAAIAILLFACSNTGKPAPNLSILTGTWDRQNVSEVSLFRVISGRLEKMATYNIQDNKNFSFAFTPEKEAFYVIGTSPTIGGCKDKYVFYFKPGDNASIAVNDSGYVLTGKNTKENVALTQWHDYVQPLEHSVAYNYQQTYVDFFPMLDEKTTKEYQAAATGNKTFDKIFTEYRRFDMLSLAISFLMSPRTAHPQGSDFSEFYKNITVDELTETTAIFNYPYGARLISMVYPTVKRIHGETIIPDTEAFIAAVKNDTIKGELVLEQIARVKDYPQLEELTGKYGQYLLTDDQKARLKTIDERIAATQEAIGSGRPALNFKHKDRDGKEVSLSDFKGKVVYIDVWATWCGPCRKEFPHLKELEKKFQGKNIVFIGVSIDEAKDYEKWKAFLDKEQLPGIQLFGGSGWNSEVAKRYQIKGIPRFLLINKAGNIVSADAPRPSAPELQEILNKLL